ncbi:DUF6982 domain-containing protein [Acidicapsa ligni]|uniref:DUF6982 domain-containing protein n=1 Tax=Acidicapsa ligni TaxID=542300 RepID=UPI0021E048D2|nr:hypothetical protein [Acidicapsa ligni]
MIVRKFTQDWAAGYAAANPADSPVLELLDSSGKLAVLDWEAVKWVCYVRDPLPGESAAGESSSGESAQPERLLRRRFTSRPRMTGRMTGLWVRLTLRDADVLEGIVANDRSLIEGVGILLTPPDTRTNTQRVFVPRSSIRELIVLSVIGAASAPHSGAGPGQDLQPTLFPTERVPERVLLE